MPTNPSTTTATKNKYQRDKGNLKLHITKEDLYKGIQTVQLAVSTRSTLPVLSNVLFEATEKGLRLSATDLEVGIRTWVKSDIISQGAITIPGKILADFIKTLEDDREIELEAFDNHKIEVKSGRDRLNVTGLPATDYPVLPEFEENKMVKISRKVLRDLVKKTIFAASSDETRYVLNGILLIIENGRATAVATDGRRLAYIQRPISDKKIETKVIIPTKAINELLRLVQGDKEEPEMLKATFTENQAGFSDGETVVLSRLIEGHFPNFEQVIPKTHEIRLPLKKSAFQASISRAAVGTLERGGSIRLSLSKGLMRIQAAAQGRVEVEAEVQIDYDGGNFDISFNPVYMLDFLKSIDQDEIFLELTSPLNPGVIRPTGEDTHRYIMMPMK